MVKTKRYQLSPDLNPRTKPEDVPIDSANIATLLHSSATLAGVSVTVNHTTGECIITSDRDFSEAQLSVLKKLLGQMPQYQGEI